MQHFSISEWFSDSTRTYHLLRFDKQDISNDRMLCSLIHRYDICWNSFHPKWKPFWQTPPLPEYI